MPRGARRDIVRCANSNMIFASNTITRRSRISLRSNNTRRRRISLKKALAYASAFFWWGKVDSDHRSQRQQIYSLPPLATREFPHIHQARCVSAERLIIIHRPARKVKRFLQIFDFSAQKSRYSRRRPSTVTVTTCHGMNFPLACSAVRAACSSPPQHGTSIRTTVTLWILLERMISVSFSA